MQRFLMFLAVTLFLFVVGLPTAHAQQSLSATKAIVDSAALQTSTASDPRIAYSTYIGAISDDYVQDIAVDKEGNLYVVGYTYNKNLGGIPNPVKGYTDAFVGKLNPAGTAWQWITYVGGNKSEQGHGIVVGNGAIWITGYTDSSDFPVTANAYQSKFAGFYDVMLVRLNPNNGAVTYSSFFGYEQEDVGRDIAIDTQGNVYVTGKNNGANVLALKLTGEANPKMVYNVQWGDDYGLDIGNAIAVDAAGNAYITGKTDNAPNGPSTFPIKDGAIQPLCAPYRYSNGSSECSDDAFLSILNAAGTTLLYSSLLGGSGGYDANSTDLGSGVDEGLGIALDAQGNIYLTGLTYALDFPTVNAAYPNYPDATNMGDAWVTKLTPDGKTILYSTYLGGDSDDSGRNIVVDGSGSAYVLGYSRSSDFPAIKAFQPNLGTNGICNYGGAMRACYDNVLTKLTSSGTVVWSSYLGGALDEIGYGVALDQTNALYTVGTTESMGYPTTNDALQRSYAGSKDGFLSKIVEGAEPLPPPPPAGALRNGNFEQGADASWTESSSNYGGKGSLILTGDQLQGVTPHSGKFVAWLGGAANETSDLSQTTTLSTTASELRLYYLIGSEDTCGKDVAEVKVNDTLLKRFELCQSQNTPEWTQTSVDLTAYANQSVTIRFIVRTDGAINSNFLLDDVALVAKGANDPGTPSFRVHLPMVQK